MALDARELLARRNKSKNKNNIQNVIRSDYEDTPAVIHSDYEDIQAVSNVNIDDEAYAEFTDDSEQTDSEDTELHENTDSQSEENILSESVTDENKLSSNDSSEYKTDSDNSDADISEWDELINSDKLINSDELIISDDYISEDDLDADGFTDSESSEIPSDLDEYDDNNRRADDYYRRSRERKIKPLKSAKNKNKQGNVTETKAVAGVSVAAISAMRAEFPQDMSNADLISAFVYVHCLGNKLGSAIKLSEKAENAVKEYSGDNAFFELNERIDHIEYMLARFMSKINTIETAVSYLVSERLWGQNQDTAVTPKTAQFRDSKTLDTLDNLRKQAEKQREQDAIRDGRPKRK